MADVYRHINTIEAIVECNDNTLSLSHALPATPLGTAYSVSAAMVETSAGDSNYGTVKWRTLINNPVADSGEFVLGIAEFDPHGTLKPHRHRPAEFYLGLQGSGIVTIEGTDHIIAEGVAIYIPQNAEHCVLAGANGLRFAYGFAESSFESIEYNFTHVDAG